MDVGVALLDVVPKRKVADFTERSLGAGTFRLSSPVDNGTV